ncbi:MAG: DUF120 domain-containing protein, partial [Promethearchaeota archaeon]
KYLLEIAKLGGFFGSVSLSSTKLGERLGTSQQTASRRLQFLEEKGFITRTPDGKKSFYIAITDKGRSILKNLYDDLNVFFAGNVRELRFKGEVLSGIGEGKYYMMKYEDFFYRNLAIKPFPGTLNVKIINQSDMLVRKRIESQGGILLKGFSDETRSFGDVWAFPIKITKSSIPDLEVKGFFLKISRTHYEDHIVEIISEHNLRKKFSLSDGDIITIVHESEEVKDNGK